MALLGTLGYGPEEGNLDHNPNAREVKFKYTGRILRDSLIEVQFFNPNDPADHAWDYGFSYRDDGRSQPYRTYVNSSGDWTFAQFRGQKGALVSKTVGGHIDNSETTPSGSNFLRLIVIDSAALFFVNNVFFAFLDVSAHKTAGDSWIDTSFERDHEISGKFTHFRNLVVLQIP